MKSSMVFTNSSLRGFVRQPNQTFASAKPDLIHLLDSMATPTARSPVTMRGRARSSWKNGRALPVFPMSTTQETSCACTMPRCSVIRAVIRPESCGGSR